MRSKSHAPSAAQDRYPMLNRPMKLLAFLVVFCVFASPGYAGFVLLHNGGADSTTGDNLNGITAGGAPSTVSVEEVPGLMLTVSSIGPSSGILTSSANSLGIDSSLDSFADQFERVSAETMTFRFDKPVIVTELEFWDFDANEQFEFYTATIAFDDLGPGTGQYIFASPLEIPANNGISIGLDGAGGIGLRSINLTAVPEPSAACLLSVFAGLATTLRRRRKA